MSTLKVNKIRDTSGSADAITLDPSGGAVLAGVTTISTASITTAKVGAAVTITESGIEASGIGITCANINGGQIGGRRNIIINGAMNVAQRGTSSTSSGIYTVDRVRAEFTGTDEAPTQAQVDVTSGTSPYTEGFRKALKITNGNQTSGAGAADFVRIRTNHEGSNLATSGWNYTSSSSFITVQFWVRSSVAQTYQAYVRAMATTSQVYVWEFALSANTWTKVIKTIPGNSNIVFDNNNQNGLELSILPFMGTDYTTESPTLNAWGAFSGGGSRKDMTSTWYTTNDATFELTGLQLEVGSQATAFEHLSFGEELSLCQRYFCRLQPGASYINYGMGGAYSSTQAVAQVNFPASLRAYPTFSYNGALNTFYDIVGGFTSFSAMTITQAMGSSTTGYQWANIQVVGSGTAGNPFMLATLNNTNTYMDFDSEL